MTYIIPFKKRPIIVGQGFHGFSHRKWEEDKADMSYSIDFVLSEGTKLIASRSGVVVAVYIRGKKNYSGTDAKKGQVACEKWMNELVIKHSDGTYGAYAHLKYNSSFVKVGDKVKQGQVIALSGNTGWSSQPHLDFTVFKKTKKYRIKSLKIKFKDYKKNLEDSEIKKDYILELMKKQKLVSLKKYGFAINNKHRKDWTSTKLIFIRESVALALIKAKSFLPKDYNFEIHDGKRSIQQQRKIIKICEDDLKNKFPKDWKKRLDKFTGGYKSLKMKLPQDTHRHGGAVDLTILDNKGKELDMGGRNFNKEGRLNFYENLNGLTKKEKEIRDNRKLLRKVMLKAGFKPYLPEWNHWGFCSP